MHITQQLHKWGNGTGVRLPKKVLEAVNLKPGQEVAIDLQDRSIVLTPVEPRGRQLPNLADLLDGVTPELVGGELTWGQDRGQERL